MNHSREVGQPERKRFRLVRPVTGAAIAAAAAALTLVLAMPASAATDPSVTVSPSSGLSNGQTVTVTGSGYAANASVNLVECAANAQGASGCDIASFKPVTADSSGGFTESFKVASSFGSTDCTKVDCVINGAAGTSPSAPTGTSAPLKFAAVVTPTSSPAPSSSSVAPSPSSSTSPTSASVAPISASTAPSSSSAVVPAAVNSGSGTPPNGGMIAGGVALLALGGAGLILAMAGRRRHVMHR